MRDGDGALVMADDLYERDFVLWTEEQAEHLRQAARTGSNLPLDWDNLAEEIESLGRRDRREAESHVRLILVHLAKLACSPAKNPRAGWISEIGRYRFDLEQVLEDSPSLRPKIESRFDLLVTAASHEARHSLLEYGEDVDRETILGCLRSVTLRNLRDPEFFLISLSTAES